MGGSPHRRQATSLKLPMLRSPAIHSPLPLALTSPSTLTFPRHTFPATGAHPASTVAPLRLDCLAGRQAIQLSDGCQRCHRQERRPD
ncbi:hypothetical protein BLNAU_4681 [Blattamonas nauphoetae]|uniref:Uncharacterized protein n=1 Tax=Blattamonas nauphoetae TaxID=2049346 RepID=A0ABQ9Y9T4_9EUKA|nr:hypothetical protein BLNAU_4681 [Blattamonas nauphoetae]